MIPGTSNNQNGIFVRTVIDFKKDLKAHRILSLSHLNVKNGELLAVTGDRTLIRQCVSSADRHQEIVLPIDAPDVIASVHLAFTGFHAIVSTKLGQNFYIHVKTNSFYPLKNLKCNITAVGWNPDCLKDSETGQILLGTKNGAVIETSITNTGVVINLKELTPLLATDQKITPSTAPAKIQALHLFKNDEEVVNTRWLLIVVQPTRILCITALLDLESPMKPGFASSASLQAGFMNLPEAPQTIFHPLFGKDAQQSCLIKKTKENWTGTNNVFVFHPQTEPTKFGWITPQGIVVGSMNIHTDEIHRVITEDFLIENRLIEGKMESPIGISLTDYHVVLAYPSRIHAVTYASHNVVYEDMWTQESGNALGITSDPSSNFLWLNTKQAFVKYRPNDEARYVWEEYLKKGDFAMALTICRSRQSIEPEALETVQKKQAERYINEKNYTAAAEILAQSKEPFESVVLKFLSDEEDRRMGLKILLDKRLEKASHHDDRIRKDAMVFWLLDVQLTELAELRRSKGKEEVVKETVNHIQRLILRKNIIGTIQSNVEAVYRLMISHADFDMQLFVAQTVKDTQTIVNIYLLREQYLDVLEILKKEPVNDFTYSVIPQLVEHIPKQMLVFFLQNEKLRASKLLPTLSRCLKNLELAMPALKYLEFVIEKGSQDKLIHNLYVQFLAKYREGKLLEYLKRQGTNRQTINYDLEFAMRTAETAELTECIVFLYCVSELYLDAVEKALIIDYELAKSCAKMMDQSKDLFDLAEESEQLVKTRKSVWIMLAEHLIKKEDDVSTCLKILDDSGGVLSIEDIIPLFPPYSKIDDFKDVLFQFLEVHKTAIDTLQTDVREATETAAEIHEKNEKLMNRATIVKAGEACVICHKPLLGRPFFAHSCKHHIHRECLVIAMQPFFEEPEKDQVNRLLIEESRLLSHIEAKLKAGKKHDAAANERNLEKVERDLEALLGADCPLCGAITIDFIDKPFMTDPEFENDEATWIL